ncbi:hypothetical protein RJT34_12805 [Clitoria ternatea]|uniref:Uncharacterized protein n=1 Tax=Clitoria ternatea TaxID=43366 RepID=A0AAN9JMW9_CLITE
MMSFELFSYQKKKIFKLDNHIGVAIAGLTAEWPHPLPLLLRPHQCQLFLRLQLSSSCWLSSSSACY